MNLVLIGYRGTGKSMVGAELSRRLLRPLVSLDQRIVERAGKPIPEIVTELGWPGFRDLEQEICAHYAARDGLVLDCGGGIVEREANVVALRAGGRTVWLIARVATIVERILGDTQRPSLTGGKSFVEEVAEVLERRTPLYRAAADFEVVTDGLGVGAIADAIATWFENERCAPAS